MPAPTSTHDPYAALRVRNYRDYLVGNFIALVGRQAVVTVVLWQVYDWTHSLAATGLVGLVNVVPLLALSLPAGALTDRHDRKRLIALGTAALGLSNLALAALALWPDRIPDVPAIRAGNALLRSVALAFEQRADPATLHFDHPALPLLFIVVFAQSCVRILVWPARAAITPLLVPPALIGNAITWNASAFEIATISGPLLSGLALDQTGAAMVYAGGAAVELVFLGLLRRVRYLAEPARAAVRTGWREMLAGAEFIWRKPVILGASGLDLLAVVLGGVVSVLPAFAEEILRVGPQGFGVLRAAPSAGAFAMAMWIAHRAPLQRPGRALLWSVAGFGAGIVLFGVSRWFWLSVVALFLTGACDNVSVVVRQSLVQLLTPDALRGRVTAVNQIFIGSSNEIGALRAGLMSALIGPVPAVVFGGLGTIVVTFAIARAVPALRALSPLHTLKPEE